VGSHEYFFYCLLSETKDPPELSPYRRMDDLPCRPEWQAIVDLVPNRRHPAILKEMVVMDPQPVRTLNLLIHESVGRVPQGNPRSPCEGNTEKAQPIINSGSCAHLNGLRRCNVKIELRRGYTFQIGCVAEEGENRLNIKGQAHGCPKNMSYTVGSLNINATIKRSFHPSAPL
jgi:hypothetical protein